MAGSARSPIDPALLRQVLAPTLPGARTLPAEAYTSDEVTGSPWYVDERYSPGFATGAPSFNDDRGQPFTLDRFDHALLVLGQSHIVVD